MIVTIFRSRLRPEAMPEYQQWAARMSEIARAMPGYVSHKAFVAEDGERLTLVEFKDEESQRGWAREARHVEAKKKGRADFYERYKLQVCSVQRESIFQAPETAGVRAG